MGTEITNYQAELAQYAKQAAAAEPVNAGTWLSTRGGELTIDGEALPGAQAAVIILDSYRENTYYGGEKFDPDDPKPPVCYAFARDEDAAAMQPHWSSMEADKSYFFPQHWSGSTLGDGVPEGCDGCPMNQWGSANTGRGKACQNRRRLLLIPAGMYMPRKNSRDFDLQLFDEVSAFQQAALTQFKIPVTSVQPWAKYVNQLASSVQRPPFGVVTRLAVVPDAKTQYQVTFDMVDLVPEGFIGTLLERYKTARDIPFQGYLPPETKQQNARGQQFRGGRR